jgi:hypothetical protein
MNNIVSSKKKITILLVILNLLFLLYYAILAYYSRPHYDDLHFLWQLKEMSINQYIKDMYFSRSGRFMAYLLNGIVFKTTLLTGEYRYFPLLFWLAGVSMCGYVARKLLKTNSSILLGNVIVLFYNLFILTNIDFAVFNWLCAMSYYLLAPMCLTTLVLVNKQQVKLIHWAILLLFCAFLGGGQEAFSPIVLFLLFINIFYYFQQYKKNIAATLRDKRVQRIGMALLVIFACWIIVVIAPGNYARIKGPDFVTPTTTTCYLKGFIKASDMFFYYLFFYIPYYLVLVLLFLYLGIIAKREQLIIGLNYTKTVWVSSLIYATYLLLSVFPSVYLWSGFGIQRNYTPTVFFTLLFLCFHAFLFGYFKLKEVRVKYIIPLSYFGIVCLCGIMIINLYADTRSAKSYANSVDHRIALLQDLNKKGVKGRVEVSPINIPYTTDTKYFLFELLRKKNNPRPVLYYISDTDLKPNEYAYHLQRVYGLNFLIQLKRPS